MAPSRLELTATPTGTGVRACTTFQSDECLLCFERRFITEPTTKTLRIDADRHQISTDPAATENFINHSCEPNAYIHWGALEVRALRDIEAGEEVTYDYLTSDWDGEDPFECRCGSASCRRYIRGFKYLPLSDARILRDRLSPFLRSKLDDMIAADTI